MEEFTISRPTLREAFRILESEGLITVRRGARGGARVQEPSHEVAARYAGLVLQHRGTTVADVLDARVIVEAPAVGMLAGRRDRAAIARTLEAKLESLEVEEAEHFHEFNALVVELTGNQTLVLLTAMLENISQAAALNYLYAALGYATNAVTIPYQTEEDREVVGRYFDFLKKHDGLYRPAESWF